MHKTPSLLPPPRPLLALPRAGPDQRLRVVAVAVVRVVLVVMVGASGGNGRDHLSLLQAANPTALEAAQRCTRRRQSRVFRGGLAAKERFGAPRFARPAVPQYQPESGSHLWRRPHSERTSSFSTDTATGTDFVG